VPRVSRHLPVDEEANSYEFKKMREYMMTQMRETYAHGLDSTKLSVAQLAVAQEQGQVTRRPPPT